MSPTTKCENSSFLNSEGMTITRQPIVSYTCTSAAGLISIIVQNHCMRDAYFTLLYLFATEETQLDQ